MAEKSQLRRVIRERNQISDDDSDKIVHTLREYSEGRLQKREAAQQLRQYVPEEQQANLMGVDLDDLLPLVLALVGGNEMRGQGGIGDLLGRFLGDRGSSAPQSGSPDIGDLLGGLLGGGQQPTPRGSQGDLDLRGLVGDLLNRNDNDSRSAGGVDIGGLLGGLLGGSNQQDRNDNDSRSAGGVDIGGLLGGLLGGSDQQDRNDNDRDHNLRKRK